MIPIFVRQNIRFKIFLINQIDGDLFNRAKLLNIGFKEARKENDFDCFIFHDVDLIVEDDRAIYHCDDRLGTKSGMFFHVMCVGQKIAKLEIS